jgi:hypothetical protein
MRSINNPIILIVSIFLRLILGDLLLILTFIDDESTKIYWNIIGIVLALMNLFIHLFDQFAKYRIILCSFSFFFYILLVTLTSVYDNCNYNYALFSFGLFGKLLTFEYNCSNNNNNNNNLENENRIVPVITINIESSSEIFQTSIFKCDFDHQNTECKECYCCICIESMNNDEIIKLKCNHIFHSKCILKWFQNKKKCPLCRE